MNRIVLASAAALAASAGAALAGGLAPPIQPLATIQAFVAPTNCPAVEPVVSALQAQGFSRIEVDTGLTQARFTAMRGNEMNSFVYDCASGALLGQNAGSMTGGFEPGIVNVGGDDDNDFVDVANNGDAGNLDQGGAEIDAGAGTETGTDIVAGVDADADAGASVDVGAGAGADTSVSSDGSVGGNVGVDANVGASVDGSTGTGGTAGADGTIEGNF